MTVQKTREYTKDYLPAQVVIVLAAGVQDKVRLKVAVFWVVVMYVVVVNQ